MRKKVRRAAQVEGRVFQGEERAVVGEKRAVVGEEGAVLGEEKTVTQLLRVLGGEVMEGEKTKVEETILTDSGKKMVGEGQTQQGETLGGGEEKTRGHLVGVQSMAITIF